MKLKIYTIYDTASGTYMRPFFLLSDGQATRIFNDMVADVNHDVGKHPEDYSLHRIGTFDDNKAELEPAMRECICTAQEMLAATKDPRQIDAFVKLPPDELGE